MKKLIALMLALIISLLAFTSCGTYNGIDKPTGPSGDDTPTPVLSSAIPLSHASNCVMPNWKTNSL